MYTDHFIKADTVINHIKTLSLPPGDYILQESYAGFVCVISVATYEMAIKDILVDFCTKNNSLFGNFFASKFSRINGNIEINKIKSSFLKHFGEKYKKDFDDMFKHKKNILLKTMCKDIENSYQNIITWRHHFAHSATFKTPMTATLAEVCDDYEAGKNVIHCLHAIL